MNQPHQLWGILPKVNRLNLHLLLIYPTNQKPVVTLDRPDKILYKVYIDTSMEYIKLCVLIPAWWQTWSKQQAMIYWHELVFTKDTTYHMNLNLKEQQGNVAPFVKIRLKGKSPSKQFILGRAYQLLHLIQSSLWSLVPNPFQKNGEQSRNNKKTFKHEVRSTLDTPNAFKTPPAKCSFSHLLPLFSFLTSSDDRLWRSLFFFDRPQVPGSNGRQNLSYCEISPKNDML